MTIFQVPRYDLKLSQQSQK